MYVPMYYLTNVKTLSRTAGPFVTYADAESRRLSYPNPPALSIVQVSADSYNHCSDYAEVGDKIQWESGAGTLTGTVKYINRDLPTNDPRNNADCYMIENCVDLNGKPNNACYLNSNMMKMLKVQNISAGVQREFAFA